MSDIPSPGTFSLWKDYMMMMKNWLLPIIDDDEGFRDGSEASTKKYDILEAQLFGREEKDLHLK